MRAIFNVAVLVLGISSINKIVTLGAKASPKRDGGIKVLSFNAKLFGVYQDKNFFNEFTDLVVQKNPDILCIQEFFKLEIKNSTPIEEIKRKTGLRYHYFRNLNRRTRKSRYGVIIFSKYKIVNYGDLDFGKNAVNLCLFADIKLPDRMVRVYNVHLQSLKLERTDYELLKKIGEDKDSTIQVSKNIFGRLKIAFLKRGEQAIMLKNSMNTCGKPVILCGDFNDTPQSFAYHTLQENMLDCFMESGNGFGGTYVGPLPSLRIDYIMHDKGITSYNYTATEGFGSDHKMIEAILHFNK